MIDEFTIGSFRIQGKQYLGDIKIVGGKVRYWQNRHKQTLRLQDIDQLLAGKPAIVIIGTGCSGLLRIPDDVQRMLRLARVQVIIQKTPDACKTYNTLATEKKNIAAILQAT